MTAYRVWFDEDTAVIVSADSADAARLQAQFQAWLVTGKWYHPHRVEAYR